MVFVPGVWSVRGVWWRISVRWHGGGVYPGCSVAFWCGGTGGVHRGMVYTQDVMAHFGAVARGVVFNFGGTGCDV